MSALSSLDRETFQQLLANAYAVQESQIDRKSLCAVVEVQRLVATGELDVDGAIHHIVECARNVANATGVAIALLKGDQLIFRAGSGSTASHIGRQLTTSLTVSADAATRHEILRVEDAQADKRIEAAVCQQFGARSLLILPIYQTRTLAGVLEVLFNEAHAFQDAELRTYQLMVRQVESAILQAGPPEQKTNPIAQLPITLCPGPQVADSVETFLNNTGSLPGPPAKHSVSQRCGAAWPPTRELPTRNRPRPRHQRTLALAAVSAVLVLACWIAYSVRRPSPSSSGLPTSKAIDLQGRSKTAEALQAQPNAAVHSAAVSTKAGTPVGRRVRRVRVGSNEVDYIGEDVTVRYFSYPPAPQRRQAADVRVANIGDDVIVRYFTPKPLVKPGSR
jgi:hypothetical protein